MLEYFFLPMTRITSSAQNSSSVATEGSALISIQSDSSIRIDEVFHVTQGSASFSQTVVNLSKTCCGTGCLALPFAAKQGGILLYVVGLFFIALWNTWASKTLCDCLDLLLEEKGHHQKSVNFTQNSCSESLPCCHRKLESELPPPPPPRGTATLGKVSYYALGTKGLWLMDTLTIILLLGIIVAYQDAIRSFLQGTPVKTGSDVLDALLIAMLIAPMAVVPDMGYLNKTSAAGLSVLALALLVIVAYGFYDNDRDASSTLQWFPSNGLVGVSHWFGCTVFGFGVVPLTYNFRESMNEPKKLPTAVLLSLLLVAISYILEGIGLLMLYPYVETDILSELPQEGYLPIITRLSMVIVVMATAPLIVVPCGELIEGKVTQGRPSRRTQIIVRFGICLISVLISVSMPSFVTVLSFVGCFSVALVSFCIPPFLHLILLGKRGTPFSLIWVIDFIMFVWGISATVISSAYTYKSL